MSLTIQPKYSIGQTVYKGHSRYSANREMCPDCQGIKEWTVMTPAGETFQAPCNTCMEGYFSSGLISVYADNPSVEALTIGSIRVDTGDKKPISYMCTETGVGCGSVYDEESLFLTREEAEAYAKEQAAITTANRNAQEQEGRKRKKSDRVRKPRKN